MDVLAVPQRELSDLAAIITCRKAICMNAEPRNNPIAQRRKPMNAWKRFSLDLPVVYMLIVILFVMFFLNRGFYALPNIISMFTSYSYFIVGAIGLVFVFISGNNGIDLSIGHVMGFAAVVATKVMASLKESAPTMNPWFIILLGLISACAIGSLFGLLNGIAIAKFHIAPFIITLASQLLAMGLCYVFTNGYTISGAPRELSKLSTLTGIQVAGSIVPVAAILPIVIFIVVAVLLAKTTFGRQVILTGSNPKSARHAGISISRIYILVYLLSGVFAGIAAMFIPMCIGGVNPDVGTNLLMPMVAAVTIGGISQSGGYGNMVQAGFGLLFIICLMNAMTFLGFGLPTQQLAYGIVIVFTMTLLGYLEKKRFRV